MWALHKSRQVEVTLPWSTTTLTLSQVCWAQLALSGALLAVTQSLPYFPCILAQFPGESSPWSCQAQGETNWPVFTQVFLVFLFKNEVIFPFSKSVGTSLDCHDFSNTMDSGLTTSSTGSLMTHRFISSVPWTCIPSGSLDSLTPGFLLQ